MSGETYKKLTYKKILFSIIVVLVYLLGLNIIIPGVDLAQIYQSLDSKANVGLLFSVTGLSLSRISLFSLGLGPWMSSLIFWRVLIVTNLFHIKTLTNKQSYRIKLIISLLVATIQSLTIISQVNALESSRISANLYLVFILTTGMTILVWLGNINTQYGVGGPTVIILVSILRSWPTSIINEIISRSWKGAFTNLLPGLALLMLVSYFIFRLYQGEKRLRINRVMIDDEVSSKAYLPIPVNPAGGMPFMFSFSIVLLPQYIFYLLNKQIPSPLFEQIYKEIQLDHVLGVVILVLCLVLLTFGFSYVNIDYKEISESLKKSGDYFTNVYPGKNTEHFLFKQITKRATLAAFTNSIIIGFPMIIAVYYPQVRMWAYLIPTLMILIILMNELRTQVTALYHRNEYSPIL